MERKKKKFNLSVILLVAFWIISLALAGTLAWFTAKSNPLDGSLQFGTIEVEASMPNDGLIKATAGEQVITGGLLPGDDLTIKFSAENVGTEDAWALAHLQVTATNPTTSEPIYGFPIQSGLYPLNSINVDTEYTIPTDAEDFNVGESATDITYTVKIPTTTGNAFQGADVKVVVTVYAIQKRHMEKDDAYNEMAREAGYVIATPANAQSILNSDINGKTIIFTDGPYSHLKLDVSKETVSAIHEFVITDGGKDGDEFTKGAEVPLSLIDELPEAPAYHYTRNVNNVTFAATSGANFTGVFAVRSAKFNEHEWCADSSIGITGARKDPIRNISIYGSNTYVTAGSKAYVSHINVNNLRFENMKFTGKDGRVFFGYENDATVKNITFANCSFNTSEYRDRGDNSYAAIHLAGRPSVRSGDVVINPIVSMENITVANCEFNGHFIGVKINGINAGVFKNNKFVNLIKNSINLQYDSSNQIATGEILVENNNHTNIVDRPIRLGSLTESNMVINNETFINANSVEKEVLKTTSKSNASKITLTNCTYDGSKMADIIDKVLVTGTTYVIYSDGTITA